MKSKKRIAWTVGWGLMGGMMPVTIIYHLLPGWVLLSVAIAAFFAVATWVCPIWWDE